MSQAVTVEESGQGRYQQRIAVGQHALIADEPVEVGGGDSGPAPFDFVLAGLGACTAMTLRMYAERKSLALKHVKVELRHRKEIIDGTPRDLIQREIFIEGDLTAEQRQRMLEIANKCPVHRALTQSFVVESALG